MLLFFINYDALLFCICWEVLTFYQTCLKFYFTWHFMRLYFSVGSLLSCIFLCDLSGKFSWFHLLLYYDYFLLFFLFLYFAFLPLSVFLFSPLSNVLLCDLGSLTGSWAWPSRVSAESRIMDLQIIPVSSECLLVKIPMKTSICIKDPVPPNCLHYSELMPQVIQETRQKYQSNHNQIALIQIKPIDTYERNQLTCSCH